MLMQLMSSRDKALWQPKPPQGSMMPFVPKLCVDAWLNTWRRTRHDTHCYICMNSLLFRLYVFTCLTSDYIP